MKSTIIETFNEYNFKEIALPLIVIYENPTDFEGHFVARLFSADQPTPYCLVKKSLDEIICEIPNGMNMIPRHPQDDPKIVSVYL